MLEHVDLKLGPHVHFRQTLLWAHLGWLCISEMTTLSGSPSWWWCGYAPRPWELPPVAISLPGTTHSFFCGSILLFGWMLPVLSHVTPPRAGFFWDLGACAGPVCYRAGYIYILCACLCIYMTWGIPVPLCMQAQPRKFCIFWFAHCLFVTPFFFAPLHLHSPAPWILSHLSTPYVCPAHCTMHFTFPWLTAPLCLPSVLWNTLYPPTWLIAPLCPPSCPAPPGSLHTYTYLLCPVEYISPFHYLIHPHPPLQAWNAFSLSPGSLHPHPPL
jgi:hypothetical protein